MATAAQVLSWRACRPGHPLVPVEAAVETAVVCGGWTVQEHVEPVGLPIRFSKDGPTEAVPIAPVLSPFLFGGRPAGCFVRYLPDGTSGVVSVEGFGATRNIAVATAE
jgi:hypothetical protein